MEEARTDKGIRVNRSQLLASYISVNTHGDTFMSNSGYGTCY